MLERWKLTLIPMLSKTEGKSLRPRLPVLCSIASLNNYFNQQTRRIGRLSLLFVPPTERRRNGDYYEKSGEFFCFLLFVCVSCQSQPPGIASLIDTDLEQVEEVRVTHNNETIVFAGRRRAVLCCRRWKVPRREGRADWFPYTEEDYTVKLVAGGDEHAVTLHWFCGQALLCETVPLPETAKYC